MANCRKTCWRSWLANCEHLFGSKYFGMDFSSAFNVPSSSAESDRIETKHPNPNWRREWHCSNRYGLPWWPVCLFNIANMVYWSSLYLEERTDDLEAFPSDDLYDRARRRHGLPEEETTRSERRPRQDTPVRATFWCIFDQISASIHRIFLKVSLKYGHFQRLIDQKYIRTAQNTSKFDRNL